WRAALVAAATTAAATVLAALVGPHPSRIFWTHALWGTDRIGQLSYISHHALGGVGAPPQPGGPRPGVWGPPVPAGHAGGGWGGCSRCGCGGCAGRCGWATSAPASR